MSLMKEFREFAMRGNVIDLAVGVVIGGAFGKIISSLVANIIMPPLNLLTSKYGVNFNDLALKIRTESPKLNADGTKVLVLALGDLYAGEQRELLLRIQVPAIAALGHHHLADVSFDYVALPELVQQTITWPLAVNVVPGDEATHRVADPTVTTARLLAETTDAKRQATEALRQGDNTTAADLMSQQSTRLRDWLGALDETAPEDVRQRITEEADQADKLADGARNLGADLMRKSLMEDLNMESQGRNNAQRRERSRNKRHF